MIMYVSMYEEWGSQASSAAGLQQYIWLASFMKMISFDWMNWNNCKWMNGSQLMWMNEPEWPKWKKNALKFATFPLECLQLYVVLENLTR